MTNVRRIRSGVEVKSAPSMEVPRLHFAQAFALQLNRAITKRARELEAVEGQMSSKLIMSTLDFYSEITRVSDHILASKNWLKKNALEMVEKLDKATSEFQHSPLYNKQKSASKAVLDELCTDVYFFRAQIVQTYYSVVRGDKLPWAPVLRSRDLVFELIDEYQSQHNTKKFPSYKVMERLIKERMKEGKQEEERQRIDGEPVLSQRTYGTYKKQLREGSAGLLVQDRKKNRQ